MDKRVKKVLRTLQSEFPFLKEMKNTIYLNMRRQFRLPHERDFRALSCFSARMEGCIIDVGSNHGQSIESILLTDPHREIISFEANRLLAQKLIKRYRNRPNIRIVETGLSDARGNLTLFVPSYKSFNYDGLASFDRSAAAGWINEKTVFGFNPAKLTISELSCKVDTLDAQRLKPGLIKIDVQGFEYNVLKGGQETLRAYEPVLLIESFRDDERTVNLASELNYEEYHFDGSSICKGSPVHGPNSFLLTPGRFNALFSNNVTFLVRKVDVAAA